MSSGEIQLNVVDLGRIGYADAYAEQCRRVEEAVAAREAGVPIAGTVLLVEHEPVVTVSQRPSAAKNLIATSEQLAAQGVEVVATDRGGDITYHGPGQLVVYPILDLNHLGLRLHDYMRLLESAVIDVCGAYGVAAGREACATGVWVGDAKICAMGVRVRKWVSMHGLALNVTTDLRHFNLIVPCGLVGRGVTSLQALRGERCPAMEDVKREMAAALRRRLSTREADKAARAACAVKSV